MERSAASTVKPPPYRCQNNLGKILRSCESEIIGTLEKQHLILFTTALQDQFFLPPGLKKNLDILHQNTPHKRMCRYVLQHVYEAVDDDEARYENFLDLLSKVSPQANAVIQMYSLRKTTGTSSTEQAECESNSFRLRQEHLEPLCAFLSKHSSLWDKFAVALLGDPSMIHHIAQDGNGDSAHSLSRTLEAWILCKSECGLSPTLENLKVVLGSPQIQLDQIVDDLDEHLKACGGSADHLDGSREKNSSNSIIQVEGGEEGECHKKPQILGPRVIQNPDTEVAVLLEVDIHPHSEVKTCKWYKNGYLFAGSSLSILCINIRDITAEGTYKCVVHFENGKVESDEVTLCIQTSIDGLSQVINQKYLEVLEVRADSWPFENQDTFTQLAVIKNKGSAQDDDFSCQTIRGSIDDIFSQKAATNYMPSFKHLAPGNRILIESRPGSGKTTLVYKITQDWAKGMLEWRNIRLLLLVHLRGFQNNPSTDLKDILSCHCSSDFDLGLITKYAEKHQGMGIAFILDGLDEYQPKNIKDTYISKLIKRQELPKALVIVASRPTASALYRNEATKCIEVCGFYKEQVNKYIESYIFSEKSRSSELKVCLDHHPNVEHMCHLPLQAAMICFLFDELEGKLPRTKTEIYKEFTKYLLSYTLCKEEASDSLKSIFSLEGQEANLFQKICKLAFNKMISQKQILQQSEIEQLGLKGNVDSSLGLIVVDLVSSKCGFQKMYNFFHLGFQEFLAACHIVSESKHNQVKLIQKYGGMVYMKPVFQFFYGLVQFDEDCSVFKTLLEHTGSDLADRAQYAFESQNKKACDLVVGQNCLDLSSQFWSPTHMASIGYSIVNATRNPVKNIKFDVFLYKETVQALIKEIRGGSTSLKHLQVTHVHASPKLDEASKHKDGSVKSISNCIFDLISILVSTSTTTVSLALNSFHMDSVNAMSLSRALHDCKNLTSIDMEGNCMGNEGLAALASVFEKCELTSLNLSENIIGDEGMLSLCFSLQGSQGLKLLDLSRNEISEPGACYLVDTMHNLPCLEVLDLEENNILRGGAVCLSGALLCCKNLTSLHLSGNNIGDTGVYALVPVLPCLESLTSLHLGRNNISSDGAEALSQVLQSFANLTSLDLSSNTVSDYGVGCICESLSKCKKLETLHLGRTLVSDDGALSIADNLHHLKNLKSLDLGHNAITLTGAKVLSKAFQTSRSLTSLYIRGNRIKDTDVHKLFSKYNTLTSLDFRKYSSN